MVYFGNKGLILLKIIRILYYVYVGIFKVLIFNLFLFFGLMLFDFEKRN